MGLSNLNQKIGNFFYTLGFLCAICFGLFRMCKVGVEKVKEKVTSSQEAPVTEEQNTQETSQK